MASEASFCIVKQKYYEQLLLIHRPMLFSNSDWTYCNKKSNYVTDEVGVLSQRSFYTPTVTMKQKNKMSPIVLETATMM